MANVIEQIVSPASYGGQIIEMNVRSNERGPQGEKGDTGDPASVNAGQAYTIDYGQQPQVMNTGTPENAVLDFYIPAGQPGAIHYTAGPGINITEDNRIEATGEVAVYWGDLVGDINNQTDLSNALNSKQGTLTAGTNITISGDTISSKEYTAGSGLALNDGEFSVDTTEIQPKLTAGSNIQINDNTISATDTTYSNFVGADGGYGGSAGLVPAPIATDNVNVLKGDGTWGKVGNSNISNGAIDTANIVDDAITASKIDFSTLGGNYSTSEQDTGFTWIDGKHIYKKTYTQEVGSGNSRSIDISSLNIDTFLPCEAIGYWNGGAINWPYYVSDSDNGRIYRSAGDLNFNYAFPNYDGRTVTVTIYYTKTS